MTMSIKSNTPCYLSQRGYYNFVYPKKDSKAIIRSDCKAEKLPWISGGPQSLVPVKVRLADLKSDSELTSGKSHIVVWIEKK